MEHLLLTPLSFFLQLTSCSFSWWFPAKRVFLVNRGRTPSSTWYAKRHGQPLLGQPLCRAHVDLETCLGYNKLAERLSSLLFIDRPWAKTFLMLFIRKNLCYSSHQCVSFSAFGAQKPMALTCFMGRGYDENTHIKNFFWLDVFAMNQHDFGALVDSQMSPTNSMSVQAVSSFDSGSGDFGAVYQMLGEMCSHFCQVWLWVKACCVPFWGSWPPY